MQGHTETSEGRPPCAPCFDSTLPPCAIQNVVEFLTQERAWPNAFRNSPTPPQQEIKNSYRDSLPDEHGVASGRECPKQKQADSLSGPFYVAKYLIIQTYCI